MNTKVRASAIFFFILLTCVFTHLFGQLNTFIQPERDTADFNVYHQSLSISDYSTAIIAVYYLSNHDPAKYNQWLDTLDYLFFKNHFYEQSFKLSDTLLVQKGITDLRLEIRGASAKALGDTVNALMAYTLLFNKSKKPIYGFKEMQLEYEMKRMNETITTGNNMGIVIGSTKDSSRINILGDNGNVQKIFISAATANIMGLAYEALQEKNMAIEEFNAALKLNPEFVQANNNLKKIIADNQKK